MGPLPRNAYSKGDCHFSHVRQCFIMGVMQHAHLQTARRSRDRPHNVYKVEYEVGICELIGVVSAIFLLPVSAAGASECDFSPFFDVSAPPCARSSTGDGQSAISGYASGRRYAPHDSDHAECEGVSNTTPCTRIYRRYIPGISHHTFSIISRFAQIRFS